ncbi:MAG: glycosyltransferase family 9 protein [Opitutales bacterium]
MPNRKILAIKFKYLGDVALVVPALRALREAHPDDELHLLIAAEAFPIVEHLPWLHGIWPLPRERGRWNTRASLKVIRQLRRQGFDRSVDFVGNDRGAYLSRLIGAKERLGVRPAKGYRWRRSLYHQTIEELDATRHESVRDWYVLHPWKVPEPTHWQLETHADPAVSAEVQDLLPEGAVVAHLSTSQPKKEWPVQHWAELWDLWQRERPSTPLVFSTGPTPRERALLDALRALRPDCLALPAQPNLRHFLAVLAKARAFVSPDTAPLHLAAGLGLPTVALFGPTSAERWAPLGPQHRVLRGHLCGCSGHMRGCENQTPCMEAIPAQTVFQALLAILASAPPRPPA